MVEPSWCRIRINPRLLNSLTLHDKCQNPNNTVEIKKFQDVPSIYIIKIKKGKAKKTSNPHYKMDSRNTTTNKNDPQYRMDNKNKTKNDRNPLYKMDIKKTATNGHNT